MATEQHSRELTDGHTEPHHPEDPAVWGWHGEWGRAARVGGWVVAIILLLMMTATHYNLQGALFLGLSAGFIVVIQIWDINRRRNAWRK